MLWKCKDCDFTTYSKVVAADHVTFWRGSHFMVDEESRVIESPSHYTQGKIECVDAIKAALTPDEFRGYLKGTAMKYIWRMNHKGKPSEDAKKAQWFINKLVESVDE